MLRITTCTKKLFLAALLCCSSLSNLHAWQPFSFFSRFAGRKTVPFLLINKTHQSPNKYHDHLIEQAKQTIIKTIYPHFFEYIQQRIKNAKLNPEKIALYDGDPGSLPNILKLPIQFFGDLFEKQKSSKNLTRHQQMMLNILLATTEHEIGHLKSYTFHHNYTLVLYILFPIFGHILEYNADSYSIQQLTNTPQIQIDDATLYLSTQPETLQIFVHKPLNQTFLYHPIIINVLHWIFDTHGSNLARANRVLKKIGIKTSQSELAQELLRQITQYNQYKPSWSERLFFWRSRKQFIFDMNPILAASQENKARADESEKRAEKFRELLTLGGYGD